MNGFLTFQSGAPFGVLNGADPGGVVLGNLVGTSIRPFLNTNLNLSSMGVREIQAAGGRSPPRAHGLPLHPPLVRSEGSTLPDLPSATTACVVSSWRLGLDDSAGP